jgi:AraC family transcriptional regulator
MREETGSPKAPGQAKNFPGVAVKLHWEPMGTVDVPPADETYIAVHVGAAARLTCRRDGRTYTGTAVHGDIDIIPAHTSSRWMMHDKNDTALYVGLPPSILRAVAQESGLNPAQIEIRNRFQIRDAQLEGLCWAIQRETEQRYPSGRLYLEGLALAAASRLVARHSSAAKPTAEPNGGLSGPRLKRVLSFIEDQLAEHLPLEDIAAVAGVGPSHLQSLFRASIGMPVHRYVILRRVERAKELLLRNGMSMADIAAATGFAHQSHMARHVRRVLGVPPREVKRLLAGVSLPSD